MSGTEKIRLSDFLSKKVKRIIIKEKGIDVALKQIDMEMDKENQNRYQIKTIEHAGKIERCVVGQDGIRVKDLSPEMVERWSERDIKNKLIERKINPDLVDELLA